MQKAHHEPNCFDSTSPYFQFRIHDLGVVVFDNPQSRLLLGGNIAVTKPGCGFLNRRPQSLCAVACSNPASRLPLGVKFRREHRPDQGVPHLGAGGVTWLPSVSPRCGSLFRQRGLPTPRLPLPNQHLGARSVHTRAAEKCLLGAQLALTSAFPQIWSLLATGWIATLSRHLAWIVRKL